MVSVYRRHLSESGYPSRTVVDVTKLEESQDFYDLLMKDLKGLGMLNCRAFLIDVTPLQSQPLLRLFSIFIERLCASLCLYFPSLLFKLFTAVHSSPFLYFYLFSCHLPLSLTLCFSYPFDRKSRYRTLQACNTVQMPSLTFHIK